MKVATYSAKKIIRIVALGHAAFGRLHLPPMPTA